MDIKKLGSISYCLYSPFCATILWQKWEVTIINVNLHITVMLTRLVKNIVLFLFLVRVSIVTGYRLDNQCLGVCFPVGTGNYLLQCIQIGWVPTNLLS